MLSLPIERVNSEKENRRVLPLAFVHHPPNGLLPEFGTEHVTVEILLDHIEALANIQRAQVSGK
jgi:hypothetical protein